MLTGMRYFVTFICYGARLRGDEAGSVDLRHNLVGQRRLAVDPLRVAADRERMSDPPFVLDATGRVLTLRAIREVCAFRGWSLYAAHVRSNHVHSVVEADLEPERVMNDCKAYASRALNSLEGRARKRWARHGSTRWLWKDQDVRDAIRYVVDEQGEAMAVYVGEIP